MGVRGRGNGQFDHLDHEPHLLGRERREPLHREAHGHELGRAHELDPVLCLGRAGTGDSGDLRELHREGEQDRGLDLLRVRQLGDGPPLQREREHGGGQFLGDGPGNPLGRLVLAGLLEGIQADRELLGRPGSLLRVELHGPVPGRGELPHFRDGRRHGGSVPGLAVQPHPDRLVGDRSDREGDARHPRERHAKAHVGDLCSSLRVARPSRGAGSSPGRTSPRTSC